MNNHSLFHLRLSSYLLDIPLAGFIIMELPSVDAALEWAARCPGASIGAVEVRPLAPKVMRRGFTG